MRQGDSKLFLNSAKLTEMLNLRNIGFSYNILAKIFSCDRTSLSFQCDRYQIKPVVVYDFKTIVRKFLPKSEVSIIAGHKIYN